MLPSRNLRIPKETEEQLRRIKQRTKLTPNVTSRLAFFTSIESGYRYSGDNIEMDSSLNLDKVTWLGELAPAIDATLQMLYPKNQTDDYRKIWADHVRDGVTKIRASSSLIQIV